MTTTTAYAGTTSTAGRRGLLAQVFAIFFASGFAALLYQVIWQRMLGLFSGSDVRSATIIVGAYLAGLGIGSLIGSLIADRLTSRGAVRLYGLCNLLIAAFAVISRPLFYDVLFLRLSSIDFPPVAVLGIVFAGLLVPTILMGLSMPLLSRALVHDLRDAPRLIGWLYAINTLGAGVGTLVAGWYLAGTLGYERSLLLGALISAGVGVIALRLSPLFETESLARGANAIRERLRDVPRFVWVWCGLVFLSGFIAISLEIIAFRALVVVLKSNAYTYGHFLIFVLIGDAIGGMLGARAASKVRNPLHSFLRLQAIVALFALAILPIFAWVAQRSGLHLYFENTKGFIDLTVLDFGHLLLMFITWIVLPALALLPPNLLLGYYYPLVQKAIQTDAHSIGQRVGLTGVANILGNAAGSLFTGLVLLEIVGTRGALTLIGLIGVAFVAVLLWNTRTMRKPALWVGQAALGALLVMLMIAFPAAERFWPAMLGIGDEAGVVVAEDASGISILRPDGDHALLYVDGIVQGAIPFMTLHSYLGALPALVHPDPSQALVIGIGSAGTPYSVGVNPALDRIVAVEIIGSEIPVLRAHAETYPDSPLLHFFSDPRVEVVVGDGRRELALSPTPFDIIEADAIYPWRSHAGMLYSREYFESARAGLAEGGLMAQWTPTPRVEATFLSVFPYVVDAGGNVLLGSSSPIPFDQTALLARFDDPQVVAYLARGGVDAAELRAILAAHTPRVWTPETHPMEARQQDGLNTDLFPRDEYYLNVGVER